MKKIIITYGLISGAIVASMFFITFPFVEDGTVNFDNGMLIGYASMVIGLSMVFFGIKTYRDQYSNGSITFWQGFKIGILIALIASVMYAISWEFYYNILAPDFTDRYTAHYIEKLQQQGASTAEIATAKSEMASFSELYKNPVVRFGMTLMEILPVGLILTLVSAGILRKREFLPA